MLARVRMWSAGVRDGANATAQAELGHPRGMAMFQVVTTGNNCVCHVRNGCKALNISTEWFGESVACKSRAQRSRGGRDGRAPSQVLPLKRGAPEDLVVLLPGHALDSVGEQQRVLRATAATETSPGRQRAQTAVGGRFQFCIAYRNERVPRPDAPDRSCGMSPLTAFFVCSRR